MITGASNASPIVITTNSTALLATGLTVTISGVGGNTAANGTFTITVLNATTFQLNGSMGNGTYTSGGHWALAARAATFWTFQEFASAPNVWSVEMAEITVALPQATLPTVGLSISSSQLGEDYGTVTIAASLTGGVPSSDDIEVNLLFGGSATENGQYSASGETIFIPAGSLSGSITLTGLPVNTLGTPTVTVSINQASLFNATPGSPSSVSATIEDTDPVAAGNISGEVYNDLNFSGTLQAGDPGLGNVLVFLDKNNNGTFDVATDPYIFTTAAGATQGDYTFFGLANGAYNVYQVSPSSFSQTQPAPGTGYLGVSPPASGINFGDAQITNPNASVSINIPQITDDKSSGTLTVKLAQGTAVPVSVTILVGGLAPFTDYTLTGPSGTVTLTAASDTFVATIPAGKTSVAYTITANSDSTNTNETITFRVVNVANATLTGSSQVETSIVTASGSPALVIDSPTQLSSTGLTPGFSFGSPTVTFQAGNQPDYMIEADLSGNGVQDLVVANSQASSITVILNPTSASPTVKTYSVGPKPTGIVAADFNNDGALDLAVSTSTGVTILENNGYGGFTLTGSYAAGSARRP